MQSSNCHFGLRFLKHCIYIISYYGFRLWGKPLRTPCRSVDANRQKHLLPEQEIKELEVALPLLFLALLLKIRGSDPGVRQFHHSDLRRHHGTHQVDERGVVEGIGRQRGKGGPAGEESPCREPRRNAIHFFDATR